MSLQSKFRTFHEKIKLRRFEENDDLRKKRDVILDKIRKNCARSFDSFNQGSYEMGTGVKPVNGDFDIDVGLIFPVINIALEDPLSLKGLVFDAVDGHTDDVKWKEPCVTVQYRRQGDPVYHVDVAIYAQDANGQLHLARGKRHSASPRWEACDPKALTQKIGSRFSGEDKEQFRRVVQYLKRWKDLKFPADGNAAPVGIGLTILAYNEFSPVRNMYTKEADDLAVLRLIVRRWIGSFSPTGSGSGIVRRIVAKIPVAPHDDVFQRMTDQQSEEFRGKLASLLGELDEAWQSNSAKPLIRAFGSDFPE